MHINSKIERDQCGNANGFFDSGGESKINQKISKEALMFLIDSVKINQYFGIIYPN